jgi:hypothetical protein
MEGKVKGQHRGQALFAFWWIWWARGSSPPTPCTGTPSQALRLGALRLLLFKLLLFDVLLTCTRAPHPHPPHLAPVTGGPHSTCSPAC